MQLKNNPNIDKTFNLKQKRQKHTDNFKNEILGDACNNSGSTAILTKLSNPTNNK
jgi:hypothetical protein